MIGTTHRKDDKTPSYKLEVKAPLAPTVVMHDQPQSVAQTVTTPMPVHQPAPIAAVPMLGNPYPAHHFGLGMSEIIKMNVDSHRLTDRESALAEAKEEMRYLKAQNRQHSLVLRD
jgi:hypothetical protein